MRGAARLGVVFAGLAIYYCWAACRVYLGGTDESFYVGLAQSMAAGDGYSFDGELHSKYPPGVSLFLLPVIALFGADYSFLVLVSCWAGAAGSALAIRWMWMQEQRHAWALAALLIANAALITHLTRIVNSDGLFFLLVCLWLILLDRSTQQPDGRRGTWLLAIAAFSLGAGVVAVRLASVTCIAATALYVLQLHRREQWSGRVRVSTFGFLAGGMLALSAWSSYVFSAPHSELDPRVSYIRQFLLRDPGEPDLGDGSVAQLVGRFFIGLPQRAARITETLGNVPWVEPAATSALCWSVVGVLVAGWWRTLRGAQPLSAWFVLCYVGLYAAWPYDEQARFWVPLLPILLVLAVRGLRALDRQVSNTAGCRKLRIVAWIGAGAAATELGVRQFGGGTVGAQTALQPFLWAGAAVALHLVPWARGRGARGWRLERRTVGGVLAGGCLLLGIAGSARQLHLHRVELPARALESPLSATSEWLRALDGSPILMASDFAALHWLTGLRTVPFPVTAHGEILAKAIVNGEVDMLVVDVGPSSGYYRPDQRSRLEALERTWARELEELFRAGSIRVLQVPSLPQRTDSSSTTPGDKASS